MENYKKITGMKTIFLFLLSPVFFCGNSLLFAQNRAENFVLQSTVTGNQTYIASDYINLKLGFSCQATAANSFSAIIDPAQLFPPTENSYADSTGKIVALPSQGAVVGNLSGAVDVSGTGAATYNVPIPIPPGIQGMQPNISLVYNSQSGNGIAGMCWNIGGLSMISRVPKDYYFDNERTGIIWDNSSPLALDGQRLISIQQWGTDSIEYRTESGLDKIMGYTIKTWGPQYFKIYTKDGKILMYGNPDSEASYYYIKNSTGSFNNLGWFLYQIKDINNNLITFTYANSSYIDNTTKQTYFCDNRILKIEYGNNTTKAATINFNYKYKSYAYLQYIDTIQTKNQLILDKIEVTGLSNELQDTYQLYYTSRDQNDYLTQIKRTNASGEYIQPIKLDWYPMNYTYNFTKTTIDLPQNVTQDQLNDNFTPYAYGDVDGDGLVDLLIQFNVKTGSPANYWAVYKNTGNGSFKFLYKESWDKDNEKTFVFLDADNDGKDELYVGRVKLVGSTYTYYLNCYKYTNNSFQTYVAGDKFAITTKAVYDKRNSLFALPGDFVGNGTSQFIIFSANNTPEFTIGIPLNSTMYPFGNSSKSKIFLTDINGNGKPEIAFVNDGTTTFYEYQNKSFVNILSTNLFNFTCHFQTGDFNGDGNTDLLVNYKSNNIPHWKTYLSTGKGFIEKEFSATDIPAFDVLYYYAIVSDINSDGKSDILVYIPNFVNGASSSGTLKILLSNGDNTFSSKILDSQATPIHGFALVSQFKSGHSKDVFSPFNYLHSASQIIALSPSIWFNKINKITDSFGRQLTITYTDSTKKNPYSSYQNLLESPDGNQSIISNFLPNLEVVSSITASDFNQSYEFTNPQIDKQSKGFLGFSTIRTTDNLRSIQSEISTNFDNTYYFLYPFKNTVKTTGGALISETTQTYTVSNTGAQRYFLRQDSLIAKDALRGITVKTSYSSYDTDRNPQTIKTDYGADGILTTEALTYIKKGSLFLNKVSTDQITQSKTGQSNVVRKNYYFYDDKGNRTGQTIDSTDVNQVRISYGNYDSYGNPQKITTTANGISRSISRTYCSYGRFLKTETDDQTNQTTTYNYDESKGLLKTQIDRIGTTTYAYDNFGRLASTTYPDNTKSVYALQWAGTITGKPASALYYSYTAASGQPPVWIWYDQSGREIRRDSYGLNKKKIITDTEYNSKGQVYRVSEPYFEYTTKTYAGTYTYDSYGRISTIVTPSGTTSYAYSGLTTIVNSPTDATKTTINNAGWITEEETNGKKVGFIHYASGLVKTATPQDGPALSMEYDLQGNRTKLTDPDAGVITSKYDGMGRLTREAQKIHITGDSIVTAYYYLISGLPDYKVCNGETTNYGYDNRYRLTRISIKGKHSRGFTYDPYDRIIQTNDTVDDSRVYIQKTDYDLLGNVYRETYPSGYYVTNQYDLYGYLTERTERYGLSIWKAVESNAKGQLTKYSQGNNTISLGIDSRGFPTSIACGSIINMSYSFTSKGNLDYRQDNLTGYMETFSYDPMNRLKNWYIYKNNVLQKGESLSFNDLTGNIATKSDLGNSTMNYGEVINKPHALTSLSGAPAGFPADNLTVTYTDFKKIKTLTEGAKTYALTYGVDEQRVKSVYAVAGATQLTRYYMGDYEEEINSSGALRMIHYLGDGAVYINTNGKDSLLISYRDYLGSLVALTDYNGAVLERYAYDPWGGRRNPSDWTQKDSRASWRLNRGFTGHEHLDAFGIINMNGRVYDPLTAQFFSPDPYLQAPNDWLNYNRYAYCFNNPLKYTDPDGEYALIDDLIAAAIGGVVNLAVNAFQGNLGGHGFWGGVGRGFAAFGAGAVGGVGALYPEFGGWIWGGATVGATNSWLGGARGWDIAIGAGVGVVSGVAGGAAGQWGGQYLGGIIINGTNITSPVLQGAVTGTIGGAVGGYAGGFTSGLIMTGDLGKANSAGLKGAAFGAPIGGISGSVSAYRYAVKNDINPWNGNLNFKPAPAPADYNLTPNSDGGNVTLYRGTTGSEGDNGYLYMTDDPNYAASYVANGGKVVEVTIPRNTLDLMIKNGILNISPKPQLHINGTYGIEYQFHPSIKPYIVPRFK